MKKKNICILYGGKSGEHEVSLRSAASVAANLDTEKYNISAIGIDKSGRWYLQESPPGGFANTVSLEVVIDKRALVSISPSVGLMASGKKLEIDFIFPVLHGTFGEDGTVQGLLELTDIPYAGAGVMGSSVGMDKEIIKKIWMAAGLDTVPFISVNSEESGKLDNYLEQAAIEAENKFGYPLFIKPARGGSSVGISRVEDKDGFFSAVEKAFRFDNRVLIEPAIDAREIECSVIGNLDVEAFVPGEIAPTHEFYDYEAKYIDENGALLIIPANISAEMIERVQQTAVKAFKAAGIEGMARVDFFIDRKSGRLLLNEVNTIPGFTSISMFSKMCEAGGLPYPELLDRLIVLGTHRHETRKRLVFSTE